MSLISKSYVKQNFPAWEHYAAQDPVATSTDEALDNQIAEAETELANYVTVDATTITEPIKQHLLHITKYNLFMLQHADTDFERKPMIVKDYDRSIEMLIMLRDGETPPTPPDPSNSQGKPKITAKRRRFGGDWFRDNGGDLVDSTDDTLPYT